MSEFCFDKYYWGGWSTQELTELWSLSTCSWTSSKSELSISMKMGTAPAWITTRVWWDVPDAMLVNTHAASNWKTNPPTVWVIGRQLRRQCAVQMYKMKVKMNHAIFQISWILDSCDYRETNNKHLPAKCSFLSSLRTQQSARPLHQWRWLHQWVDWALWEAQRM